MPTRPRVLVLVALFVAAALAPARTQSPAAVTSPRAAFGSGIGDDYFLATYRQLESVLAAARRRVRSRRAGGHRAHRGGSHAVDGRGERAREPGAPGSLPRNRATARRCRRGERRRRACPGAGRQGRRLDRRRPPRQRGARRAAADRAGLSARQRFRRRDAADPARRRGAGGPRQPGRSRARGQLVHAYAGSAAAVARRRAAPVPEVRRPRQQPRLLSVEPGGDAEHEPRAVSRMVPADRLQPSPGRTGRHGDVRAAVPGSVQLRLRSAHSRPASTWSARRCRRASPPKASPG